MPGPAAELAFVSSSFTASSFDQHVEWCLQVRQFFNPFSSSKLINIYPLLTISIQHKLFCWGNKRIDHTLQAIQYEKLNYSPFQPQQIYQHLSSPYNINTKSVVLLGEYKIQNCSRYELSGMKRQILPNCLKGE